MAHDSTPDLRTRGVLDLSTGPAAPPPPAPAPRPPATPDPDVRVGKVLDLSKTSGTPRPARASDSLGHGPVVRETIDLSMHTPPKPTPSASVTAPTESPRRTEPRRSRSDGPPPRRSGPPEPSRSAPRGVAPASASSSLADLLDPEVLARLRGDG